MNKIVKPVLLSIIPLLLFWGVAITPVTLLGCRNRGLTAVIIALLSAVSALVVSFRSLKNRLKGNPIDPASLISVIILILPAVYILLLFFSSR
jgi:hypothetical protein